MAEETSADAPTLASEAPFARRRFDVTQAKRDAADQREAGVTADEKKNVLDRHADPDVVKAEAALKGAARENIPILPTMQPTPEPVDRPIVDHEQFKSFGMLAFPFVLLLGKVMRADGTQALNALSSSVQGYMQGRQEESKRQFEVFKQKMQKTLGDNKQKLEEYRAILERRDMEMQQKMQLLQIAGQKYDDAALYHATERKSIADIYKHLDAEDSATAKVAEAERKISKDYEDNYTKMEVARMRHEDAQQRITMMGTNRSGAAEQKKVQWLRGQQINIYKTFSGKMAALTAKQQFLTPGAFALAEQQLRIEFAKAMKLTNDMGRSEGFEIPPDAEAMEHPENDPFGPSTRPQSGEENKGYLDALMNGWKHMFGVAPGANPSAPPPQGPTNTGGWSATPK